jgi:hypothetical protein
LPIKRLLTFGSTQFNYIFLASSLVNDGDTVVRKGNFVIDQPTIVLPRNSASFEGFSAQESGGITDEDLSSFFYVRGISFPSLKYINELYELDVFEGSLAQAEKNFMSQVREREDIATAIMIGADTSWQFSTILTACQMIDAHIDHDLKAILDKIKKKKHT